MSRHSPVYDRSDPGYLISQTIIIPSSPTGVKDTIFPAVGRFFRCKESTGAFKMSFDNQQFFDCEVGIGFDAGQEGFNSLIFRNTGASDITITFYAGNVNVIDARLNTLISRQVSTYQKNYLTFSVGGLGTGVVTVTNAVELAITLQTGYARKQVVITNLSATADLEVRDSNSNPMGTVMPRSAWTVETGDIIKLFQTSGSDLTVRICEIYYAT